MKLQSFVDKHALHNAFLGAQIIRLLDIMEVQGDDLYAQAGLSFPPRASSTILLISESDGVTTADIARELCQPHQLATQRVETLIKSGLLKRKADPADARRKNLILTKKGKEEAARLRKTLREAQRMFENLYEEIGADLSEIVLSAISALTETSINERIAAARRNERKPELRERVKTQRRKSHA